jgi:tetratricopeptide (TPR) repeat protein
MGETLKSTHPDRFTLLLLAAGELDEVGRRRTKRHLDSCARCSRAFDEVSWLDRTLTEHREEIFSEVAVEGTLPAGDPFSTRPEAIPRRAPRPELRGAETMRRWSAAARSAEPIRDRILQAPPEGLEPLLESLSFDGLVERYGLGFALDQAPLHMSQGPVRFRPLADLSLRRLGREREVPSGKEVSEAEFAYPLVEIAARAHLLDGIICNWTGEYDRGSRSFVEAWSSFAAGLGSDHSLATVEVHESQRRSFDGDGRGGLVLAERARATFEELGNGADAARALYAAGIALGALDREEESIESMRRAAGIFAEVGLWRPYTGAVASVGASLMLLGRLAEARRELARALRLVSSGDQPAAQAALRNNLGMIHFRGGDYAAAARSFSAAVDLYRRMELPSDAAVNGLHLAESLVRIGKVGAAKDYLAGLEKGLAEMPGLDPAILREFARQLSGDHPDFERLRSLRERLEASIRQGTARTG